MKQRLYGKIEKSKSGKKHRLLLLGNNHTVVFTGPFQRKDYTLADIVALKADKYIGQIIEAEGNHQVFIKQADNRKLLLLSGPYRSSSARFDAQTALNFLVGLDWKQVRINNIESLEL